MEAGALEVSLLVGVVGVIFILFSLFGGSKTSAPSATVPAKTNQAEASTSDKQDSKMPLRIFFGSQTGTAETFASELADEAKAYGFHPEVVDLEEFDASSEIADETFSVFLMATFGEGDPTDNAVSFWEWTTDSERKEEEDTLSDLTFAVFALGNRQYEHFCNVGNKVWQVLKLMGGQPLLECGEGDDDGHLEENWSTWKESFWAKTRAKYGLKEPTIVKFEPKWIVKYTQNSEAGTKKDERPGSGWLQDHRHPSAFGKVAVNKELRQDISGGESTVHVEIDITGVNRLKYVTADNLGVFPRNDFKQAAKMVKRLGAKDSDTFTIKLNKKFAFPRNCTMRNAMLWFIDFNATPRIQTLKILAQYASSLQEKAKLIDWCGDKKEDFLREKHSLFEVLELFPSIKPPIHHFLEFAPKMMPRYYTISSSSAASPTRISVTVAKFKSPKPGSREFTGVCSSFLCGLRPGKDEICCFVRASSFRLPKKINTTPIIMVGPGTGIAPFRGFLQHFTHLRSKSQDVQADLTLFFGCKNKSKDFIYQDEIKQAEKDGVLQRSFLAFSRDQKKKMYVQHLLEKEAATMWDLIQGGAYFYVCGATSMGKDIRLCVLSMAQKHGNMTEGQAAGFLQKMQSDGRYVSELWS